VPSAQHKRAKFHVNGCQHLFCCQDGARRCDGELFGRGICCLPHRGVRDTHDVHMADHRGEAQVVGIVTLRSMSSTLLTVSMSAHLCKQVGSVCRQLTFLTPPDQYGTGHFDPETVSLCQPLLYMSFAPAGGSVRAARPGGA
jgi:hypothetical protein